MSLLINKIEYNLFFFHLVITYSYELSAFEGRKFVGIMEILDRSEENILQAGNLHCLFDVNNG